jgi:hypothetical protein
MTDDGAPDSPFVSISGVTSSLHRSYLLGLWILAMTFLASSTAPVLAAEHPLLIPQPRSITLAGGRFRIDREARLVVPPLERPEWLAVEKLLAIFETHAGFEPALLRGMAPTSGSLELAFVPSAFAADSSPEAYRLHISNDGLRLEAKAPHGMLHGLRTLHQLVRQYGADLPALMIDDAPDFPHRGFYHDVSRGKVPKIETLLEIVDEIASTKYNQFQLYVEHAFEFRTDPALAHGDALTSADLLRIQERCKDHRIDFVPSLQSFGHLGAILSLPAYRHLAEIELTKPYAEHSWRQRMSGATLNVRSEEALAFLRQLHGDFLPHFDSRLFNVCADETYDLGNGKNKALAEKIGKGVLYLEHINRLNEWCRAEGRTMMFWGDIVKQHPKLIPAIPKDAILLNWGYSATTDFESTKLFKDAGLKFYVCPGTSGWLRLLADVNNADLNIRRYAATGKKYGALGLLNTDWGDHGHVNTWAGSLHGTALGGAMAWNAEGPDAAEFDRRWSWLTFGDASGSAAEALRAESVGWLTWIIFYAKFSDMSYVDKWEYTAAQGEEMKKGAAFAVEVFERYLREGRQRRVDIEELLLASRYNQLMGEKVLLMHELRAANGIPSAEMRPRLRNLAAGIRVLWPEYEAQWLRRNRPTELYRLKEAFDAIADEADQLAIQ